MLGMAFDGLHIHTVFPPKKEVFPGCEQDFCPELSRFDGFLVRSSVLSY